MVARIFSNSRESGSKLDPHGTTRYFQLGYPRDCYRSKGWFNWTDRHCGSRCSSLLSDGEIIKRSVKDRFVTSFCVNSCFQACVRVNLLEREGLRDKVLVLRIVIIFIFGLRFPWRIEDIYIYGNFCFLSFPKIYLCFLIFVGFDSNANTNRERMFESKT